MDSLSSLAVPSGQLSYGEALEFWYGCINYEQRSPRPDDLKLDQIRALLRQLGNPQERLRIIHIAGSKGKGSTAAMIASILRAAGYRTGLFTSPHLCQVEERVQVNGQAISRAELASLLTVVQQAVRDLAGQGRSGGDPFDFLPTFFEVATALGFLYFERRRVDWAVVEVGLGGRLDSTNLCMPQVALITSISSDHTRQLGSKLTSIAAEKAGIVKSGRPVISGPVDPEVGSVIQEVCRQRQSPLRQVGSHISYSYEPAKILDDSNGRGALRHSVPRDVPSRVRVKTDRRTWPALDLALLGEHQAANAAVAIGCIEELQAASWQIPDSAVATGLAEVSWPARLEIISHRPLVVLDCAHNVASAHALLQALETSFFWSRGLLIFGSSNDKDVQGMLKALAPRFARTYLTQYANSARAMPPGELARILAEVAPTPYAIFPAAIDAWRAARHSALPGDLICVAGSVFLAGELRPVLLRDCPGAS